MEVGPQVADFGNVVGARTGDQDVYIDVEGLPLRKFWCLDGAFTTARVNDRCRGKPRECLEQFLWRDLPNNRSHRGFPDLPLWDVTALNRRSQGQQQAVGQQIRASKA